ncbi:Uncharacterized protein Fot_52325 [Forsythia ovata]|uniref:Uncharacterized protein n=1 Tax=Forsythia ovata TaxID=205694 RepID=A0ABD1PL80_9LAMI
MGRKRGDNSGGRGRWQMPWLKLPGAGTRGNVWNFKTALTPPPPPFFKSRFNVSKLGAFSTDNGKDLPGDNAHAEGEVEADRVLLGTSVLLLLGGKNLTKPAAASPDLDFVADFGAELDEFVRISWSDDPAVLTLWQRSSRCERGIMVCWSLRRC